MKPILSLVILISILILPKRTEAQFLDKVLDFLTVYPNKKAVAKDSTLYPAKAIFTPVVSFSPETNLSFGVGMKGLFKPRGAGPETRTSNIPITVQYTIENKYLFFSGFDVFFPKEKYRLSGNVSIQSFPSLYFGIGPDTPASNEEAFAYRQLLLEPIFLRNVLRPNLFLGLGLRYNRISGIEAEPGGILINSNHAGSDGSTSVGTQMALIYDSRDNVLNANQGMYFELTHGFYGKYLGGSQAFQLTRLDLRYYVKPFKKSAGILAMQLSTLLSFGNPPLLEIGRLGGDEIMRGYFEGRFTDNDLIATQIEWRQKLNYRWGFVAFAGIGTVAPEVNKFNLQNLHPAFGLGLRFMVDPEENLNVRLDLGYGKGKLKNYLKIAEAF